jgi:hypothetical protein
LGDEGKAVGCVPPTALLSLRGLRILTSIKESTPSMIPKRGHRFSEKAMLKTNSPQKFKGAPKRGEPLLQFGCGGSQPS